MVRRCGANANEASIGHCLDEHWCLPRFWQWGTNSWSIFNSCCLGWNKVLTIEMKPFLFNFQQPLYKMGMVLTIVMKPTTRSPLSTMPGTPFILNQSKTLKIGKWKWKTIKVRGWKYKTLKVRKWKNKTLEIWKWKCKTLKVIKWKCKTKKRKWKFLLEFPNLITTTNQ